ncbi:MAG: ABC transporter ATP-binding protein [Pseudomonadales bacterium]
MAEREARSPVAAAPGRRDYSVFEAELAGKAFDARLLGRLFGWIGPHWRFAVLSGLLVMAASVLAILMPVIVSRVVIDGLLVQDQPLRLPDFGMTWLTHWLADASGLSYLVSACVLYLICTTLWGLGMHLHRITMARAVLGALRDLRLDLFSHLETRPASFYDKVAVGRVMTRVTNDVEVLFQLLQGFGVLLGEFAPFFVALILMLAIDWQLTLLLLASLPLLGVATWLFRRTTRRVYRRIRQSVSQLNQNLQENISGMPVVQLSGREQSNLERYSAINRENRGQENNAVHAEVLYGAFVDSMASAAVGAILWFGGGSVLQQTVSLGSVVLFTQFVDMLFRPVVAVGEQYNVLFRAMASLERIFQALDWDERVPEPERPVALPERLRGRIEVRDLSFGYEPGVRVLKHVSFSIEPGEKLAVVGATGSGKSTLIRLLARLYEVPRGCLFLDGVDVNDVPSAELRRRIGIVLQDFHVFSGSIADNISLGKPEVDRARVEAAARHVNAHGFISRLPQGYDTPVLERGQNLSQGQRQLLAFARVLAADPEILVLDEATASVDTETELLIQDALKKLTAGRTSIIIAHRLQTIQDADRVLVLQHGEVQEIGTHEELLSHGGIYHRLYSLQFQDTSAG